MVAVPPFVFLFRRQMQLRFGRHPLSKLPGPGHLILCSFSVDLDQSAFIFILSLSSQVAMERIAERNRKGEANVTEDYESRLAAKHESWLMAEDLNVPLMQIAIPYDDRTDSELRTIREIEHFIVGLEPNNIMSTDTMTMQKSRAHKL